MVRVIIFKTTRLGRQKQPATVRIYLKQHLFRSASRHESLNGPVYGLPAQRAVLEGRGALHAADEVAAGNEHHADLFVHAHFADALLSEATVLLLQGGCNKGGDLLFRYRYFSWVQRDAGSNQVSPDSCSLTVLE